MLEDDVLVDHRGGHTCKDQGEESRAISRQEKDHHEIGHPYHPWHNANELWITNLVYTQAQMMMTKADLLLKGIIEKCVVIERVDFHTAKKMYSTLDSAEYTPVHYYFCGKYLSLEHKAL